MLAEAVLVGYGTAYTGTDSADFWIAFHVRIGRAILADIDHSGPVSYGRRLADVSERFMDTIVPLSYGPFSRARS